MFTADTTIDAVSTANKTMVNTFVQNETIKDSMLKFIDVQSEYTKKASKVTLDTTATLTQEAIKAGQEAMKFDYNMFYDTVTKAFQVAKAK